VLWTVLLTAVVLIPLGVGLPLTAVTLRAMRGLEAKAWRHMAGWCGFAVAAPRPAGPARQEEREPSLWVRFGSLLVDPDTWRSLLWSIVDMLAGWLLSLAPHPRSRRPRRRQQRDRADQAEQQQHGDGGHEEDRQLAEELPAARRQVHRAGQQEDEEQQPEEVAVPLERAGQVGPSSW
jgi:hypothetical protein